MLTLDSFAIIFKFSIHVKETRTRNHSWWTVLWFMQETQHRLATCTQRRNLELTQTHVHHVGDAIQPSHPLSSPSPPAFKFSHSIRVFSNELVLHIRWPKYWSFSFSFSPSSEYSGLISFRIDWLDLFAVLRDSQESSPTLQFKSINSSALSFLYGPTLASTHDYWKNHSFD